MTGYDVDGALARGGPAVEVLSDYVAACRALGCTVTDPAQLHDAYTAEDGMDLGALDADCAAITAALGTVEEAARLQESAQAALAAAWQGSGADIAAQVIAAHAQSSEQTVSALHRVADTLTVLRDDLWHLVTGKVAAVQDIEDRAERAQWWPAARAVTTGAGAQDSASEIVDGKVNPFVTVAIGSDWAEVMESTKRSVRDAYDTAAAGLSADQPAGFGSLGSAAGVTPAAAAPPVDALAAAPAPAPASAPAPAGDPFSGGLPLGGLGSGMSSVGGGFTGAGQQLADLLGGLFGTGTGTDSIPDEPLDIGERDTDEPEPDDDREEDEGEEDDADEESEGEGEGEPTPVTAEKTEVVGPEPDPPAVTPVPEPVPAAPVAAPMAAEPPPEAPRTPCEIAADELPQAGG
ncbi:hypothetical protein HZU40_10735 [Mycolicibacterium fluoranthenivorans]|uniref:Uncharacterized protein n=1 Tax=Mycolicibacterium fluoranthenivorans TaxID=258505 RepID=A0A7G8PK16_9MYCO|nr:hypothetical protein [Mycolicibacterium fluoranthenivorans]QNJ94682.1 hypothetical protein HZU40_10735 [Mycolicibacterium fluoranthenivorans]